VTDRGPAETEAFVLSDTEKFIATEPVLRGVPLIKHKAPPVVGSAELMEADKPAPFETEHAY
jgi:hypothetical protein